VSLKNLLFCDARHSDPTNKMIILMSWGASNCFLEEVMAHFGDRAGVSESAQGSWPTFSTDVKSAVFFIGQSTLSLITRLTGTLRTWRQRERKGRSLRNCRQPSFTISASRRWIAGRKSTSRSGGNDMTTNSGPKDYSAQHVGAAAPDETAAESPRRPIQPWIAPLVNSAGSLALDDAVFKRTRRLRTRTSWLNQR
jgi:hypothetical protein